MSGIINVNKLVTLIGDRNHYTYMRVKNMLMGLKGQSSAQDIQRVRKIIHDQLTSYDKTLSALLDEIKKEKHQLK